MSGWALFYTLELNISFLWYLLRNNILYIWIIYGKIYLILRCESFEEIYWYPSETSKNNRYIVHGYHLRKCNSVSWGVLWCPDFVWESEYVPSRSITLRGLQWIRLWGTQLYIIVLISIICFPIFAEFCYSQYNTDMLYIPNERVPGMMKVLCRSALFLHIAMSHFGKESFILILKYFKLRRTCKIINYL